MNALRIGLMGFGQVGRQIYRLALNDDRFDTVAIADIGQPDILHHLLSKSIGRDGGVALTGNHLVASDGTTTQRTRLMSTERPGEIPWDLLGVDVVIDATGRYRSRTALTPHLDNGARRVVTSSLPEGELDRVVLYGVNQANADSGDRIVSAGSASTTAMALALRVVTAARPIAHATMTSVHAYTRDQSLYDHAGPDYRRSRAAAGNIIPNTTPAPHWVEQALPSVKGKVSGFALNVPVAVGSLLDVTLAFEDAGMDAAVINEFFIAAAQAEPDLIAVTHDPIVSSDVRGFSQSILVDLQGTLMAGDKLMKLLAWHEILGHASRILDVAAHYAALDETQATTGAT
ncbi:MAG: glyceraldehyde-3-phosphate dehydrogenase [Gammaproteobacteria bacterium]|nr:glyceraldehyde-3-phosphate dehydrogenase [Gammaproteobacteria bacterium]